MTIKPTKTIEGLERDKFLRDQNNDVAVRVVLGAQDAIPVIIEGGGGGSSSNIEQDFADGDISAVKALYKTSTGVALGNNNATLDQATILGISRNAALNGEKIKYQTTGRFDDSSLNFPLNAPLYLGINGQITDIPPNLNYRTYLGFSLGNGAIQINIEEPIIL